MYSMMPVVVVLFLVSEVMLQCLNDYDAFESYDHIFTIIPTLVGLPRWSSG